MNPRPDWVDDALCRGDDPAIWHPEYKSDERIAVAVCHECPVRADCLEYALVYNQRDGIWGGLSPLERIKFGYRMLAILRPGAS